VGCAPGSPQQFLLHAQSAMHTAQSNWFERMLTPGWLQASSNRDGTLANRNWNLQHFPYLIAVVPSLYALRRGDYVVPPPPPAGIPIETLSAYLLDPGDPRMVNSHGRPGAPAFPELYVDNDMDMYNRSPGVRCVLLPW
jgi:hypothetical protein